MSAVRPDMQFEESFITKLEEALEKYPDKTLLIHKEESFTYGEVSRLSASVAHRLITANLEPGFKGVVYSNNSAISFVATLGILRAGGVWIPINPRNSEADNLAIMRQFDVGVVFYESTFCAPVEEYILENDVGQCLALDDVHELDSWLLDQNSDRPDIKVSPDDLITIPMTGGTTGAPKGVMLSNRNFRALAFATADNYGDREVIELVAAPMTHAAGRRMLLGMPSGATFVILDKFNATEFLAAIEEEKVTDFFLPPTAIYSLLDQAKLSSFDLTSLVSVLYGSAPMSIDRLKEAISMFGPVMQCGYGQTECPLFIARLNQNEHFVSSDPDTGLTFDDRLGSVGRSTIISEVSIVDEAAEPLGVGQLGEVAVKGPMVSEGYYNDPEETQKIRKNGWHLTGDIGYLSEEGYLYLVDRKKDMIVTGGFNVYSAEVEAALMRHPDVDLAAVVGVPDEKWGELVCAYVALKQGSDVAEQDIVDQMKVDIGSVKAPKKIFIVESFPQTAVGKIDKKVLRERSGVSGSF